MDNNQLNNDQVQQPEVPVQPIGPEPVQPVQPKTNGFKKVLMIIGGVIVAVIVIFVIIFTFVSGTSNKLICKSDKGNITIMYNDDTITGYTAKNMEYDLDGQKEIANNIGIEKYIDQFDEWFETNIGGTCTIKNK